MKSSEYYLTAQFLMSIAMYLGTFLSYYLPIRYFRTRLTDSNCHSMHLKTLHPIDRQRRTERILSTCNCLATGVFIAMCFISLMPMVNQEFRSFLTAAHLQHIHYPIGELTMLLGFFLMLLLENRVLSWRSSSSAGASCSLSTQPFLHLDDDAEDDHPCDDHPQYKLLGSAPQTPTFDTNTIDIDRQTSHSSHTKSHGSLPPDSIFETNPNISHFHYTPEMKSHQRSGHSDQMHSHHDHFGHFHEIPSGDFGIGFLMLMFASSVHSVFEGLALGLIKDVSKATHLFVGILLHECLVSVALGINASKMQKGAAFGLAFAATIPVGMGLGVLVGYTPGLIGQGISAVCQALAAGTFIHVTFYELLPAELQHGQSPDHQARKILLMLAGFLLMAILDVYCD